MFSTLKFEYVNQEARAFPCFMKSRNEKYKKKHFFDFAVLSYIVPVNSATMNMKIAILLAIYN